MYMRTVELARQTLEERQRESTGESTSVACSLTSATTALGESADQVGKIPTSGAGFDKIKKSLCS